MRKTIIPGEARKTRSGLDQGWLELEGKVRIELTSEDAEHPIESALLAQTGSGWRAQEPGKQTIRLLFDEPQRIRRIQLLFEERERARTQEFVLRGSRGDDGSAQEILRQQYNFSPPDSSRELEDYSVELDGLTMLELSIIPDISGGETRASLARLRLG
jgi:hypothetical protein